MAHSGQAAVQQSIHAGVLCSVTDLFALPLLYGISYQRRSPLALQWGGEHLGSFKNHS